MLGRNIFLSLVAAIVTALFLPPTLRNLGLFSKIPYPGVLIYIGYPILAVFGMFVAWYLGSKIKILWQLAKFGLIGVLNTAVDFGILNYLITLTGIKEGAGIIPLNIISFSVAVGNSYFWNKGWVFESRKNANFISFVAVSIVGILINTAVVYILTTYVPHILIQTDTAWANVSKIVATFLSLAWNFAGYRLIVFKK